MNYTERDLFTNSQLRVERRNIGSMSDRPNRSTVDRILSQLSDPDVASQNQTKCWMLERLLHASEVGGGEKSSIMACVNLLSTESDSAVKLKAMEVLNFITPVARQFECRYIISEKILQGLTTDAFDPSGQN